MIGPLLCAVQVRILCQNVQVLVPSAVLDLGDALVLSVGLVSVFKASSVVERQAMMW